MPEAHLTLEKEMTDHWPPRVADRVLMKTPVGSFLGTVMESEDASGYVKFDTEPPWDKIPLGSYTFVIVGEVGGNL